MCGFLQYMIVFSSLYKFCEQTMRCETRCLHFFAYTQKLIPSYSRFLIALTSHKKQKNGDRNSHYNLRQYRTINRMKSYEKGITSCHPCQDLP